LIGLASRGLERCPPGCGVELVLKKFSFEFLGLHLKRLHGIYFGEIIGN